jgi:hypothetical protein
MKNVTQSKPTMSKGLPPAASKRKMAGTIQRFIKDYSCVFVGATKKSVIIASVIILASVQITSILSPQSASAANFGTRVGYYVGTGASKTISGLGFQPSFVIIKSSTAAGVGVFKTSAMAANTIAYFGATADNTAANITFTTDGFTVGTIANVNTTNVLYRWIAFSGSDCTSTGYMCVGTYTGTGATTRTITTGFQPDMIMVKRSTAVATHFQTASMAANRTEFFTSTAANTAGAYIRDSAATGFSIGTTDNASGGVYYYVAFRSGAGNFAQGTYSGNGTDNRSITGLGFQPDLVVTKNSTSATTNNRRSVMSGDKHFGDQASYVSDAVADTTNMIQAMESNGFQVGSGASSNESGYTMYWFAFGGVPSMTGSGTFTMAQGSYIGSGATRSITGVGFAPDLVLIKDNAANYAVFRIRQMAGDTTAYLAAATADFAGGITSLGSDGFSLGTSTIVNTNGNTYHWQAFGNAYNSDTSAGASDFAMGTYYGSSNDSRTIADMPFQPDLVALKRNGASVGTFRTSAVSGDLSSFFAATAEAANVIQSLAPNGFQVGTNTVVNTSGALYRWFAFKSGTNFSVGSYTGNGASGLQVAAPFWSDLIWVKRSTAVAGVQLPSTLTGGNAQYFLNTTNAGAMITGINAKGFTVGTNTTTNTSGGVYRYAAWRVPPTGTLSVDIVDSGGSPVSSPAVSFSNLSLPYNCTESTAMLGGSTQKIRVANMTANGSWALSIAPTAGPGGVWNNAGATEHFDYNDIAGSPIGCDDGADLDGFGGKLRVEPSVSSLAAQSGCFTDGVTRGSDRDFSEGIVDSVPLITSAGANTECYWDITGISLRQMIPKEQTPEAYTLGLTLTLIAQ